MRLQTLVPALVLIAFSSDLAAGDIPLGNWTAPPVWHPTSSEGRSIGTNADLTEGMPFFGITPCRAYDSRVSEGGAGPIPTATARTIDVDGSTCGPIPTGVGAYSLNITVFGSTPDASYAFITAYPTGSTRPLVSSLNFLRGTQVSNAVIVPAGTAGNIDIYASAATEVVVDINGYYSNVFNPGRALVAQVPDAVAILGVSGSLYGVIGISGGTDYAGVFGSSLDGKGVQGSSSNSYGVWASSDNHDGLWARSAATTGARVGVIGSTASSSNDAHGVRGLGPTLAGDRIGNMFVSGVFGNSKEGYGVNGISELGTGVQGVLMSNIGGFLARGRLGYSTGGTNYGIYSEGHAHVAGTLSKSGGSFKIDHPVDPENRTLSHSFVESPDMMNIYNGNVILDRAGRAVVQLPEYFQALNREFRYQLTPIGAPGPNLYIEQKISGNQFIIAGGRPAMEVSWQVTGVRKDAWAEKFRIPVEELKRPEDRGYFLNPEAFDLPAERGIGAAEEARRHGQPERLR
jgi:hypothetical protein